MNGFEIIRYLGRPGAENRRRSFSEEAKMKKALVFLLLLSIPVLSPAQTIKLISGISLANIRLVSGYYPENPKSSTRFVAGLGFESGGDKVLWEVDVLYFQKGCRAETGDIRGNFNLDEISVPVLLKLKFAPETSPFILAGGEAAYVLSYKNTEGSKTDLKKFTKSFDYGLVFGGGLQLIMDTFGINIEARYHYGLADLGNESSGSHFKTSTFVFAAGLIF
jgi:hypothetical protein